MPDNANPQAVKFANEKARLFAEAVLVLINTARAFEADYAAQNGDTLFPNDAILLADGSEVDGRPRMQNQTLRALRTMALDALTWAATGSPTRETRVRSVTARGESRF